MKDLTNQPDQHELSIKEKLMKTFEEMGFTLEACPDSDGYYLFHYEGLSFLWLYNEDDEQFFNLSLPGILDIDDDNREVVRAVTDKVNSTIKYVKAYPASPDSLWLFYERKLMDEPDYEDIITHMIIQLERSKMFAHKVYDNMTSNED